MLNEEVALSGNPAAHIPGMREFLQTGAARGETWEESARDIRSLTSQTVPDSFRPAYEQQAGLARAHQSYSRWSPSTLDVAQENMVPFYSTIHQFNLTNAHTEARRRLEAGRATPEDFDVIARHERQAGLYERAGFPAQITRTIAGLPAIAGEAYVGGRLVGAAGQALGATRLAAGAAAQAPRLTAAAGWAGRTAATTAAMPSMYLPEAAQNAAENGGNWSDARNLGPAYGVGFLNTAVLGSVMGHGGPRGVTGYLARIAVGMGEQQAADTISAMSGMRRHGGILENMWAGQYGEAAQHATLQALTFGMLGAMHHEWAPSENPVLQSVREAFDFSGRSARRSEAAAEILRQGQAPIQAALQANPNLTRAEAMEVVRTLPEGPARDHARAIAQAMPTEVSRAARERPSLEQNQVGMGELEQGQPMPPGEARAQPPAQQPGQVPTTPPVPRVESPITPDQAAAALAAEQAKGPSRNRVEPRTRPAEPTVVIPKPFDHLTADEVKQVSEQLTGSKHKTAAELIAALKRRGIGPDMIQAMSDATKQAGTPTGPRVIQPLERPPDPIEAAGKVFAEHFKDHLVNTGRDVLRAETKGRWVEVAEGHTPNSVRLDFGWLTERTGRGNQAGDQPITGDLMALVRKIKESGAAIEYVAIGGRERAYAAMLKRGGYEQVSGPTGEGGELRVWQPRAESAVRPVRVEPPAPKVEAPAPAEPAKPKLVKEQAPEVAAAKIRAAELQRIQAEAEHMRLEGHRDYWNSLKPQEREDFARAMKAEGLSLEQWMSLPKAEQSRLRMANPEVDLTPQEKAEARKQMDVRQQRGRESENPLPEELQARIAQVPDEVLGKRDREIVSLRLQGNSYEVIGEKIGVKRQRVHQLIKGMKGKPGIEARLKEHDAATWGKGFEDTITASREQAGLAANESSMGEALSRENISSLEVSDELASLVSRAAETNVDPHEYIARHAPELVEQIGAENLGTFVTFAMEARDATAELERIAKRSGREPASVRLSLQQRIEEALASSEVPAAREGAAADRPGVEGEGSTGLRRPGPETNQPADSSATAGGSAAGGDELNVPNVRDAVRSVMTKMFQSGDGYNLGHLVDILHEHFGIDRKDVRALRAEALDDAGENLPPLKEGPPALERRGAPAQIRGTEARKGWIKFIVDHLEPEGVRNGNAELAASGRGPLAAEDYHAIGEIAREEAQSPETTETAASSGRFNAAGELLSESGEPLFRGEPTGGGSLSPGLPGFPRAPTAAERRAGGVGGGQGEAPESQRPQKETALANAQVDKERAASGLPELMSEARRANADVWDAAMAILDKNPKAGEQLVEELSRNPRATTVEENALLLQRRIALGNEHSRSVLDYIAEFRRPKAERNEAKLDTLDAQERALMAQVDQLDRVARQTGTEWGRAGQFRRQLAAEDYSLTRMLNQAEKAKGKPLTAEEKVQLVNLQKQIEELQRQLAAMEDAGQVKPGAPSDTGFRLVQAKAKFDAHIEAWRSANAPWQVKALKLAGEAVSLPRALMASIDFPLLRQGLVAAITHPIRTGKAVPEMFRSFFSEEVAQRAQYEIDHRPNAPLYKAAGLDLTNRTGPLAAHEEGFLSRLVDKVPIIGHITRASERSYTTVLNRIRADSFDAMAGSLSKDGKLTTSEAKVIANYVNVMTGRGELGQTQKAAVLLNHLFFAPKWAVSRFQMLLGQPLYSNFSESAPRARALVAKEYGRLAGGFGLMAGLAVLAGFKLEEDPRSSDFGKLRVGNTRLDLTGGMAGTARFLAQTMTLSTKNQRGAVLPLSGQLPYGMDNYADVLGRFVRGKLAPAPGAALNLLSGTDVVGHPVTPGSTAANMVTPLFAKDVFEAMQDLGVPRGTAVSLLGLLGMSMNTYDANAPRPIMTPQQRQEQQRIRQLRRTPVPQR